MSSINNRGNVPLPPIVQPKRDLTEVEAAEDALSRKGGGRLRPSTRTEQQQAEHATQAPSRKTATAAEQERLLAQTGFARVGRKNKRAFDLDDNTQAPIPLPVEDVDETAWEQRSLDHAQQELTLQSHELKHLAEEIAQEGEGEHGVIGRIIQRRYTPTPEGVAALTALANKLSEPKTSMRTVSQNIKALFGINVERVADGPAMVAAALVVAGHSDAVRPDGDSLDPMPLAEGMHVLVESSNAAVEDARGMSSGIHRQIAAHRTFLFKR